jgi:hypothetical protein
VTEVHERRLRAGRTDDGCDEECAHSDARDLWAEALSTFGDRAHELSFLRSRAMSSSGQFEYGVGPDNEDGIILLIGPRQTTSYCHGFGLSDCQLELLSVQVDCAISELAPAPFDA